jgi:hypothetical protein
MATDQGGQDSSESGPVLTDDVVESHSVQERDGSYHVTIPKDSARDLGISKGDNVLFTGQAGEDCLQIRSPSSVLADD